MAIEQGIPRGEVEPAGQSNGAVITPAGALLDGLDFVHRSHVNRVTRKQWGLRLLKLTVADHPSSLWARPEKPNPGGPFPDRRVGGMWGDADQKILNIEVRGRKTPTAATSVTIAQSKRASNGDYDC
jgi:hypothetical protein